MPSRAASLSLLLIVAACESPPSEMACVPGETQRCIGIDGCDGVQVCVIEGTGYNACRCNRRDAGPRDAGTDAGPPPTDGGPPDAGPQDAGADAGPRPGPTCAGWDGAPSATFLVARLTMPEATSDRSVPGFDLDGMDSGEGSTASDADCEEYNVDYISPYDPVVGVDDAVAGLKSTLDGLLTGGVDGEFQRLLEDGELLLLVRVSEIDDPRDDSEVAVTLYLADPPSGGVVVARDGRLAPDQAFSAMELGSGRGPLEGGRARVSLGSYVVPLDPPSQVFPPSVVRTILAFDLCSDGLERGVLAGSSSVDDLVAAGVVTNPDLEDTLRSIYESTADLAPSAADPAVCEQMSFSYELEGVAASLL